MSTTEKDFKVKNGLTVAGAGSFGGPIAAADPSENSHVVTKGHYDTGIATREPLIKTIHTLSAPHTITASDAGAMYSYSNSVSINVTVPNETTESVPIGTKVMFVADGTGNIVFVPEDGVTVKTIKSSLSVDEDGGAVELIKIASNRWLLADVAQTGPRGIQGIQGVKGDRGEIGPTGPQGITGPQGDVGPIGPTGATGSKGDTGDTGLNWTGDWDALTDYSINDGVLYQGFAYIAIQAGGANIGKTPSSEPSFWKVLVEKGDTGPQGPQGIQGVTGPTGLSAYEAAVADGFVGNESQWLVSLVGPTGADGIKGRYEISATAPSSPVEGDAWFDSVNARFYIYYDGYWVEQTSNLIGPTGPAGDMSNIIHPFAL